MKKLFCVILVIFLTGCSSQKANEPKKTRKFYQSYNINEKQC